MYAIASIDEYIDKVNVESQKESDILLNAFEAKAKEINEFIYPGIVVKIVLGKNVGKLFDLSTLEERMKKRIKKERINFTRNLVVIFLLIVATSLSDGISSIIIPKILSNKPKIVSLVGTLIGLQSFIGVVIFLPQASFIKKFGEKACIRISLLINIIVYSIYLIATPSAIAIGKFTEGFGDRLLNSTVSKLIYDETDNKNNRGRIRALMDATGNVSMIIGPAIAAFLIAYSIRLPIFLALALMSIVLVLSRKIDLKSVEHVSENNDRGLSNHYKKHLVKYFKNRFVVLLTIPSILLSALGIFYGIFLNVYLLDSRAFSIVEIGILWSIISALSVIIQIPSGYLADKSKKIAFILSFALFVTGFVGLLSVSSSKYLTFGFVLSIYTAGQFFTTSMSALFGDVTTTVNRLSESESYRMFRALGEGIVIVILSNVYAFLPTISIVITGVLASLGVLITYFICNNYYKSISKIEGSANEIV